MATYLQREIFPDVYRMLREAIIDFMVQPPEVLVTKNEDGDVEEEYFEDTDRDNLYGMVRETLIYLTNIDNSGMN